MREVWRHEVDPTLRAYGEKLRAANAALFVNGAGEIGLSALKLALSAGIPVAAVHEPHPNASLPALAVRLGLGRSPEVDFDEATGTIQAKGQRITVHRSWPTDPEALRSTDHERIVVLARSRDSAPDLGADP